MCAWKIIFFRFNFFLFACVTFLSRITTEKKPFFLEISYIHIKIIFTQSLAWYIFLISWISVNSCDINKFARNVREESQMTKLFRINSWRWRMNKMVEENVSAVKLKNYVEIFIYTHTHNFFKKNTRERVIFMVMAIGNSKVMRFFDW